MATTLGACSDKAKIDVTPFEPTLSRSNYKAWYDYARPDMTEFAWTLWNWSPQLAPVARMASAERKPMLLWLERGHPLGKTSDEGIQRRALWTDGSLNGPLNKFYFAADDLNWLLDSEDPEGQLLSTILEQDDNKADLLKHGGVILAAGGGKFLGSYSGQDAAELKIVMDQALSAWDGLAHDERRLAEISSMVSNDRPANLFPDAGLTLEIHRRPMAVEMDPTAERSNPWTHDYMWLSKAEIAPMMLKSLSEELDVPAMQAQRIALFTLVDDINANGKSFRAEDLQVAKLSLKSISKIGGVIRFTMSGEFKAENEERSMHCFVEGDGSMKIGEASIPQFNMSVQAQSWGDSVEATADGKAPLLTMGLHRVNSYEGSHRITPTQFDQYPTNWPVTD